ncbi:MAG: DUF4224 domain-containing protein [Rhodoferax sp.]|nr:DUF4224 domain-containing protein [Rhodoferax sp.]
MSDIFMTPDELAALTGFKSPRKQVDWAAGKGLAIRGQRQ